ncbi:hypothetical protein GCM10010466_09580 [Planomonospora alba]|uniref:Uncharacterized protein n=1 Tax=Planomonospora alba TaxID=161354 RepID=A0ABP6MNW4_9ACTN
MGFPGDSPRRQPYAQPGGPPQPHLPPGAPQRPSAPGAHPGGQGESWFGTPAPAPGYGPRHPDPDPRPVPPEAPRREPFLQEARQEVPPREPDGDGPTRPGKAPRRPAGGAKARAGKQAWSPYEEGARALLPTFVAIALVAVLIAGGVGLAVFASSGDDDPAGAADAPAPVPAATGPAIPANPGGVFGFAESRKTDPYKLTLDEVFKSKKVRVKGQSYTMTVSRHDKKCKDAVVGATVQKALTQGKCNQFLRASFRDASGKVIGTLGVANLATSAAATKVVKAVSGKKSAREYLKVLPGKDKATKSLGTGEAFAGGWRHGHYAVLVWFQYKDGHLPSASETKKLNAAAFGVADATVTPALESRSLTGKRP